MHCVFLFCVCLSSLREAVWGCGRFLLLPDTKYICNEPKEIVAKVIHKGFSLKPLFEATCMFTIPLPHLGARLLYSPVV